MKILSKRFLGLLIATVILLVAICPLGIHFATAEDTVAYQLDFTGATDLENAANSPYVYFYRGKPSGEVAISFSYFLAFGTAKTDLYNTSLKTSLKTLDAGVQGTFNYIGTWDGKTNLYPALRQDVTTGTPGILYVWDFEITVNGQPVTLKTTANTANGATCTQMKLADVPLEKAHIALNLQDLNAPVTRLSGLRQNAVYCNRYINASGTKHTYEISFDYDLVSGTVGLFDTENNRILQNSLSEIGELEKGIHAFNATYTATEYSVRFGFKQLSDSLLELYVANFKILCDGIEVTCDRFMGDLTAEETTVAEIDFGLPVMAYEISGTNAIYYYENTLPKNSVLTFSFDYYLYDQGAASTVNAVTEMDALTVGKHTYEKTLTAVDGDLSVKLGTRNTAGKLYVWNVRVKVDGLWSNDVFMLDTVGENEGVTVVDKDTIPFPYVGKVYKLDFTDQGGTVNPALYLDVFYNTPAGTVFTYSFQYYAPDPKGQLSVTNGATGDPFAGNVAVLSGKGVYNGALTAGGTVAPAIQNSLVGLDVVYIWDVKVLQNGKVTEFSDENPQGAGVVTTMTYDEIPFDEEDPGEEDDPGTGGDEKEEDPISPQPDVIYKEKSVMLKQENYKFREDKGGALSYQGFFQQIGDYSYGNGMKIKPKTTYVLEFEYYCDPGEDKTGVASSGVLWRTLYTGNLGSANQDLLKDENGTLYTPLLENYGRHTMHLEYTTVAGQTDFLIGLQSGWNGDAYIWNMRVYEKNDKTKTNLLVDGNFETYRTFQSNDKSTAFVKNAADEDGFWQVSANSADGKGTYSFVKFNTEMANLKEGGRLDGGSSSGGNDDGNLDEPDFDMDNDLLGGQDYDWGDIVTEDENLGGEDEVWYEVVPTVWKTKIKTINRVSPMDMTLLVLVIAEGALLLGGAAVAVIRIIVKKKRKV